MSGSAATLAGSTFAWRDVATCERYTPGSKAWSACAPMPAARSNHAATVLNGKIHVVGGVGPEEDGGAKGNPGGVRTLATHIVYDPATDSWETRAPLPLARAGLAASSSADGASFIVLGGFEPLLWDDQARSVRRRADRVCLLPLRALCL